MGRTLCTFLLLDCKLQQVSCLATMSVVEVDEQKCDVKRQTGVRSLVDPLINFGGSERSCCREPAAGNRLQQPL
ncbi:unnamed protein product [Schistocephalus solidus]|uniref:Secreted protein n=1 Tax=Schistocephalus solidus TaxID=70667 RepID=A0A183TUN2_SCHSO|nr:unnamed protein product [Schistocephalus solidus]